jgi:hypothetical protein
VWGFLSFGGVLKIAIQKQITGHDLAKQTYFNRQEAACVYIM